MLVIRLSRHGRKNMATFRIVLQEKEWSTNSKVIETLGNMNPHTNPATVVLKADRIKYWIEKGAQPSNTMHNLLVEHKVITGEKRRSVFGKRPEAPAVAATPAAAPATEAAPVAEAAPAAPAEEKPAETPAA